MANPATMVALASFCVNLAIPKGGIYAHGVPITWGYVLLGLAALLLLPRYLVAGRIGRRPLITILLIGAFTGYSVTEIALRVQPGSSTTMALAYLVSISIVPLATLMVTHHLLETIGRDAMLRLATRLVGAIAVWGLVHFIAMNFGHVFLGIPWVTVTGGNPAIVASKNINRGSVLKLVSTYNNGNIFGVNMLLWLPLALLGYRARSWIAIALRAALLLSLSRTVWIGWLFSEFATRLSRRRTWNDIALGLLIPAVAAGAVVLVALIWFRHPLDFLFSAKLGGRLSQFSGPVTLLGQGFGGIDEVVYMSVIHSFGLTGLAIFIAAWASPLLSTANTRVNCLAKISLMTYLLVMWSDGAFLLIPTQWTYWTLASMVLFGRASRGARRRAANATPLNADAKPPLQGDPPATSRSSGAASHQPFANSLAASSSSPHGGNRTARRVASGFEA